MVMARVVASALFASALVGCQRPAPGMDDTFGIAEIVPGGRPLPTELGVEMHPIRTADDGSFVAEQFGWTARLDEDGVVATQGGSEVGLRFDKWGREGALVDVDSMEPTLGECASGSVDEGDCVHRLEYAHPGVTEWWASRSDGLEQGFVVYERPPGDGPLVVETTVEGASITEEDGSVTLTGDGGRVWRVSGVAAWDANGVRLRSDIEADAEHIWLRVDDEGADFPIVIDPVYSTPAWTSNGTLTGRIFGLVAGAGDVNNDGFDDVMVVVSWAPTNMVSVSFGSKGGLSGGTGSIQSNVSGFAYPGVASAGDVNGDGQDDIVVGAWGYSSNAGQAYLYEWKVPGSPKPPAITLDSPGGTSSTFGFSVAGRCDVNGDGYSDVLITDKAHVFVFHGSSIGISATPTQAIGSLTQTVACAGDVNGDGYDDVIVGLRDYNSATGRALLYLGSVDGVQTIAASTIDGIAANDRLGWHVAAAGDVNGDGFDDVLVVSGSGRVQVHQGSPTGASTSASTTLNERAGLPARGSPASSAGDVNGDGFDDVVVGDLNFNAMSGQVYIYHGSVLGLQLFPDMTLPSPVVGDYFGSSVAAAGDVNGDGFGDVIIGCSNYSSSPYLGRAYVYYGYSPTCYFDVDGDKFGSTVISSVGSTCGLGESGRSDDCDDKDGTIRPTAAEVNADGIDQNCDGFDSCYHDNDGDHFGLGSFAGNDLDCTDAGEASVAGDCDDKSASAHPAATEIPNNGIDEDCSGGDSCWGDLDGDKAPGTMIPSADLDCYDAGEFQVKTDCDDSSPNRYPGAIELVADGVDQDCDGKESCYVDGDGDGWGRSAIVPSDDADCLDAGEAPLAGDCVDTAPGIFPGAVELVANGIDDNCDTNELCYADADHDGHGASQTVVSTDNDCVDVGEAAVIDDCDDANPAAYTGKLGATEVVLDGLDQDCDGKDACYADADHDGHGSTTLVATADADCADPGEATLPDDCNDANAAAWTGILGVLAAP